MTSEHFSISIIVPIYNVKEYLCECLDSIIRQIDGYDVELILVNDGSTDGSEKIAEEYAFQHKELIKYVSQDNKGLSGARNAGMALATKQYVSFVDSDDILEEGYLSVIQNALCAQELDILFFGANRGQNEINGSRIKTDVCTGPELWYELHEKKCYSTCVPFQIYSREFLESNNLKFQEGVLFEDHLFTFQALVYAKKVKAIDNRLYYYRIREGSIINPSDDHYGRYFYYTAVQYEQLLDFLNEHESCVSEQRILNSMYEDIYGTFVVAWSHFTKLNHAQIIDNWKIFGSIIARQRTFRRIKLQILGMMYRCYAYIARR